ncbi:alpha-L-rhamnosidase [Haloactinopolyspora alba]|uniref:alpha-L-rhamnosidase n=1 Tax=Haloactinopolyspora alba TaxID=648780 RepID=A0A2P8DK07_9ACTN|nr:alpha-L-rhamnosidase [Haloactinopolyspora alba]PSK97511.1 alpha-L-rhamnosidase [Haloactinopolyspora alba]
MTDHDTSPVPTLRWVDDHRPLGASEPPPPSRVVHVVSAARPRFSWIVPLVRDGQTQTAYEVRLAPDDLDPRTAGDVSLTWSSGVVESAESTWIRPDADVAPYSRYRWTVRTRDEHGAWSGWAEPAAIEAGPLCAEDWRAAWVSVSSPRTVVGAIDLPAAPVRARLHVTAQGVYRARVGGDVVNPGTAEASRTDAVRALYRTYDVTDLLTAGSTTLEIDLGASHWARCGHDPRLLAEVVAVLGDGSVVRAGTGADWSSRPSQVVVDEAFYVERHDPRHAATDASEPVAVVAPGEPGMPSRIVPDPAPPIRAVAERTATEIGRPGPGRRVYDVGTNIAGRSRVTLRDTVPAGTEIVVVHGELLGPDGSVDTTNLKMPYDGARHRQSVEYVCTGEPDDVAEAWFAFHGFRYLEVMGLPDDAEAAVTGLVLHSDLPDAAAFDSDDPTMLRLVRAARRTQLNNLHGIPEDCPTREQAGWTGDAAATTDLALAQLDLGGFYRKWLGDLATSQRTDGSIPAVVPAIPPKAPPSDPVWGSALQRVLLGHWLHYGDPVLVAEHLPALRRWVDYQLSLVRDGAVRDAEISYGHDWLGLAQTPPELLHTGATLDALDTLAALEEEFGDGAEGQRRRDQATGLRTSARAVFRDSGRDVWANGSQGANAVAVVAGLVGPGEAEDAAVAIERDVRARGNRASTGFAATTTLVRALAATDRAQVISDAVHQPEQPGIGSMLVDGPGTLWENWSIDPSNTGTGSLDHVGLGGPFAGWVWTGLVGLRPTAAGFRRFEVAPQPVEGVDRASSVTQTVRGTVRVAWERDGDDLWLDVEVPVGAAAAVRLPGAEPVDVGPGRHRVHGMWPKPLAVPPVSLPSGRQPALAETAADVSGGENWLPAATSAVVPTVDVAGLDVLDHGLHCMPVPHAQVPGPVLRLTGRGDVEPDVPHLLRLVLAGPMDLTAAQFVYGLIDLCVPKPHRRPELVLRVHGAEGAVAEATAGTWPAGWNRVALDVAEWAGRSAITAVEAGVRFRSAGPDDIVHRPGAETVAVTFHLGELGWSAARRTW